MNTKLFSAGLLALALAAASCTPDPKKQTADGTTPFLPPLMGWSSWNTYRVNINEELIKKQADALVSTGLKEAGYTYINIDDGFSDIAMKRGRCMPTRNAFPTECGPCRTTSTRWDYAREFTRTQATTHADPSTTMMPTA